MNSDRAVVFNVLFCSILHSINADRCGPDEYFGAGCESCGKLCDIPAPYPDSCLSKCPDYKPKLREISTESTTTTTTTTITTAFLALPENNDHTVVFIFLGIVALILSIVLAILLWNRIRKRVKALRRIRELNNLKESVQAEQDPENQELVPLNDNGTGSVTDNLLGDVYETLNENGRDYEDTRPEVRSSSSSTIETTATIESQPSCDFGDFSSGLLASVLSTGPSVGEGNSADRLNQISNVDGELEEDFDLGGTLPFRSLSLEDLLSLLFYT